MAKMNTDIPVDTDFQLHTGVAVKKESIRIVCLVDFTLPNYVAIQIVSHCTIWSSSPSPTTAEYT